MKKKHLAVMMALSILVVGCSHTIADELKKNGNKNEKGTQSTVSTEVVETETEDPTAFDFYLCFTGDIALDEEAVTTAQLDASENGIYDCISPELISVMQKADFTCINNEFTYSNRGTPTPNKMYTFRANPERVGILNELGVDVVNLANNHVYDYGEESIIDTMETLKGAEIGYFGAGNNLSEAMQPYYVEIGGKKIAFVGASRAEKYRLTPQATETSPGILRCYDTELFDQVIETAKANADYVIATVHWGTEHTDVLEQVQIDTAHEYIDKGADVIIGGHSHCLQGTEYYNGKPILYSLGNFWFDSETLDTMMVLVHIYGNKDSEKLEVSIVPAIQSGAKTTIVTEATERQRIFQYLQGISTNAVIDSNGLMKAEE